jgi:hypothetical protein
MLQLSAGAEARKVLRALIRTLVPRLSRIVKREIEETLDLKNSCHQAFP